MLPPKRRHILGCLALSEKIFAKKVTLPWANHILKIQWEIRFLKRHFLRRNAIIFFRIVGKFIGLCKKNCFWKQFCTSGSVPTRKRMKVEVQVF